MKARKSAHSIMTFYCEDKKKQILSENGTDPTRPPAGVLLIKIFSRWLFSSFR